jgi:hypothetical protein
MCPTFSPDAFPLLFGPRLPASDHAAALIDAPAGAAAAEHVRLSLCAPPRREPFFSDRRTGATPTPSSGRREERLAMALFNAGMDWGLGREDGSRVLDHQTPLMARRADTKVDLLGLETAGRLAVREFKVEGRSSIRPGSAAPLLALVQALRHAAIVEGNRGTLAAEVEERFDRRVAVDPPILLLLGTRA